MSFYGDETRWFVGTVKKHDPESIGRLQVRIHGIHGPDVPDDDLPYAQVLIPTTEGGASGIGKITQLKPTASVFGIFLDGKESQHPLILGSLNKTESPSTTQASNAVARDQAYYDADNITTDAVYIPPKLKEAYGKNPSVPQKRNIIMQFLITNQFSEEVAAGIIGNLERENSDLDPAYVNSNVNSVGLAQWNSSEAKGRRLNKLQMYSALNNLSYEDFFAQLSFIIHELRGTANSRTNGGAYNTTYNKLLACDNYEGGQDDFNSTWIFMNEYLKVIENKDIEIVEREKNARLIFSQWKNSIQNYSGNQQ